MKIIIGVLLGIVVAIVAGWVYLIRSFKKWW